VPDVNDPARHRRLNRDVCHRVGLPRNPKRYVQIDFDTRKIDFMSFGHWPASAFQRGRGADALLQSIELAVAAEEVGADAPITGRTIALSSSPPHFRS
jgi:hypothetical protein